MIKNKIKNTKDYKLKLCRNVLGISITCLSLITCSTVIDDTAYAAKVVSKPKVTSTKVVQSTENKNNENIKVENKTNKDIIGAKVKGEALKYLNVPYKMGGTTTKGFDCSGFTKYVFGNLGIKLPRTSKEQASLKKTVVDKKSIKAGDLLFFQNKPGIVGHVAIAVSNNSYIHASTSSKKIIISSMNNSYFIKNFVKAIRI